MSKRRRGREGVRVDHGCDVAPGRRRTGEYLSASAASHIRIGGAPDHPGAGVDGQGCARSEEPPSTTITSCTASF